MYPPHMKYPDYPKFAQARKAINAYKKATGDHKGGIDLLLTYVEAGTCYTVDFGDIDAPFYERLETALDNAGEAIKVHPLRKPLRLSLGIDTALGGQRLGLNAFHLPF
jgi:hypothetical protein